MKPATELAKASHANDIATGGQSESITGIECISADGWLMLPWFLPKGTSHMIEWYENITVVFEFSYTSALLCLDSRIIDPEAVAPDWTGDKSPLFRPLS
ncbi:hypothetical protein N7527_006476, partial [Penicillium freii]